MALICAQITPDPMKKYIGIALWIAALIIPFRFAILDTDQMVLEDGRADNVVGLISFVAMLTLFFLGYALVDSAKNTSEGHHGH
jgi:hypothetical protein